VEGRATARLGGLAHAEQALENATGLPHAVVAGGGGVGAGRGGTASAHKLTLLLGLLCHCGWEMQPGRDTNTYIDHGLIFVLHTWRHPGGTYAQGQSIWIYRYIRNVDVCVYMGGGGPTRKLFWVVCACVGVDT